jgi:pimeloyl-ACP methyl ester carboxylesterase
MQAGTVTGRTRRARARHGLALLAAVAALATGCATPIGVDVSTPQRVLEQELQSVLTGDEPSAWSQQFLQRLSLDELYRTNPREALAQLRAGLGQPDEPARLFALCELWFGTAKKSGDRGEYMASAIFGYAYLFPHDITQAPTPFDGHLRLALQLYNRAITQALAKGDERLGTDLDLSLKKIELPFGTLELEPPVKAFRYGGYEIVNPVSMGDLLIRGLRNRYRREGIGSALGAAVHAVDGSAADAWIPPVSKVPVTAFLRLDDPRSALDLGKFRGTVEVYDADETLYVTVLGRKVPLSFEPTAALAYRLEGAPIWDFELAGFRRPDMQLAGVSKTHGLGFLYPYRPGRIPVVFVHGTASSPARWAEMTNDLLGDPEIASRYQFWFFVYNSGNPILASASELRTALQTVVQGVDPKGKDPALKQMVVIGHSQGGLLTKLMVVKSGDSFWNLISDVPFESANLSTDMRALLQRGLFFEPLPFVSRVIFISTPHRGSFLAENWLGMLARRLVNTPAAMTKLASELGHLREQSALGASTFRPPTSIDNMDWSNPGLRLLASLPIAPGVHAHSIIPEKTNPFADSDDGVVRYSSAHIEPVESELVIVPAGHSVQGTPRAIEEVRRILYEHAGIE